MSKHSCHKSLCSEHLISFVDECHTQASLSEFEIVPSMDRFYKLCMYGPLLNLTDMIESPTFAHELEKMISSYDWYITNRFWGFQLLYPLVSFLRIFYSIILTTSNVRFTEDLLRTYIDSLRGEAL